MSHGKCSGDVICPANTGLVRNSDTNGKDSVQCKCSAGYTPQDAGGVCTQCRINTFKSDVGDETCTNCPVLKQASKRSVAKSNCSCYPSYREDSTGECVDCGKGMYGNWGAGPTCKKCPGGLTTPTNKAVMNFEKCTCPTGYTPTNMDEFEERSILKEIDNPASSAEAGLIDVPDLHMTIVSRDCSPCVKGSYKPTDGPEECTVCPWPLTSMRGSSHRMDCSCDAGYEFNPTIQPVECGGNCGCEGFLAPGVVISDGEVFVDQQQDCWWVISGNNPSVTFTSADIQSKHHVYVEECGDAACSSNVTLLVDLHDFDFDSDTDTTTSNTYTTEWQHLRVRFHAVNKYSQSRFTMETSLYTEDDACILCEEGTYKSSIDAKNCTACAAGTFSDMTGAANCVACDAGSYSLPGAVKCTVCDAGTFVLPGELGCTTCSDALVNVTQCQTDGVCVENTYANSLTGLCTWCPLHTTSVRGSTKMIDCTCSVGYAANMDGVECTACPNGTFKRDGGKGICSFCDAGMSIRPGDVDCTACDAGTYILHGEIACTACDVGTYSRPHGAVNCIPCGAGTYSLPGAVACTVCDTDNARPVPR